MNNSKRDIILLICTNTDTCIAIYQECMKRKKVLMLASQDLSKEQIEQLVQQYHVTYIITPQRIKCEIGRLYDVYMDYQINNVKTYDKPIVHSDLALLLSTSGSTGSNKMVRISYSNILANTKSIINSLGITKDDVAITTLPMNYTYGLSVINTHLYVGAKIIATEQKIYQKEFWKLVNENEVTSISGVPYTYEVLKKLNLHKMEIPTVKYFTQAGGRLNEDTNQYMCTFVKDTNREFYVMYGQTEATARITCMPKGMSSEKIGSVGKTILDGKIVIDTENKKYRYGDIGEVVYLGPNVTMGYATSYLDLSKGDENEGILRTGDYGYLDKEGYLYLTGRRDRYIKYFGNRISLDEMEQNLNREFGHTVLCVHMDECIYFITQEQCGEIKGKICSYAKEKLHLLNHTFMIKELKTIPKKENGKIDYKKIEEIIINERR